jgi:hypothetical protein
MRETVSAAQGTQVLCVQTALWEYRWPHVPLPPWDGRGCPVFCSVVLCPPPSVKDGCSD